MEQDALLSLIKAYCAAKGVKPTRFGIDAVGDAKLVSDLESGREPRRRTVQRILRFIEGAEAHA